jgi:hypothetical protein
MPRLKAGKKRKKVKYKTITIKITSGQYKSLSNFSKSRRTSPNKVIKKAINPYLTKYKELDVTFHKVSVNQLALFSMD